MLKKSEGVSEGRVSLVMAYSLAGAVFLSTLGVGVFAFAIPLLALRDNLSGSLLGAVFSGYFFAKLVISPIAGRLSDKIGPRPLLLGSALAGVLIPLAYFISQRHEVLYLIQFGLGLSAGVMKPVATASIAVLAPEKKRGMVFSLCNALYNVAFFLGPVLGGILFYDRDLLPVIGFLTACMGGCFLILLWLIPVGLKTVPHGVSESKKGDSAKRIRGGALLLAVFGRTACTACLIAFYPILLAEHLHGPTWLIGLVFALPSLVACIGLPVGGWLADRGNREALTAVGMVISALCLVLIGQAETIRGFVLVGMCVGLGSVISFPASMALASSLGVRQGNIMGWFHAAANAGFVVGPLLCGLFAENFGEVASSMAVVGLVGLFAALPLVVVLFSGRISTFRRSLVSVGLTIVLLAAGVGVFQGHGPVKSASVTALAQEEPQTFASIAMGNVVHISTIGVEQKKAGDDVSAAFETISALEAELGHRNYSGSVGRVNLAAGVAPEPVDRVAYDLIKRALDIGEKSDGIFDVTIGAVTVLPYYYQEKAEKEKATLIDYRKVRLDDEKQTVFLPEKGMALDLGGLAKGSILDSAAATLKERGVPSALVEAGGDLYCYGDRKWRVGIQDPRGDGLLGVVSVSNAGVCGSGDYYQYTLVEEDGEVKRKHHILDPELLDSADKSIAVTVIAPSAELADALATTLFILGPKDGQAVLDRFEGSSAFWVLPDQTTVASKNFPEFIK